MFLPAKVDLSQGLLKNLLYSTVSRYFPPLLLWPHFVSWPPHLLGHWYCFCWALLAIKLILIFWALLCLPAIGTTAWHSSHSFWIPPFIARHCRFLLLILQLPGCQVLFKVKAWERAPCILLHCICLMGTQSREDCTPVFSRVNSRAALSLILTHTWTLPGLSSSPWLVLLSKHYGLPKSLLPLDESSPPWSLIPSYIKDFCMVAESQTFQTLCTFFGLFFG